MAQMGRPKSDNPKDKNLTIRIDKDTYKEFEEYCTRNSTTKSKLILGFIKTLLNK